MSMNKNFKLENGFIILFAVTLASILLSIAIGVANVSYREVSFSTSLKDSNEAFLAADTGAECALFYDKQNGGVFTLSGPGPSQISCVGNNNIPVTASFTANSALYSFILTSLGTTGVACSKVEVSKSQSNEVVTYIITSKGYNVGDSSCASSNLHRVERELKVSSTVGASSTYTPPASTVNIKCNSQDSCSISYNGSASLTWTTTSATGCVASGPWSGNKTWPSGAETTANLTSSQTYTLTCNDLSGGVVSDSVTVTVGAPPVPAVTTTGASSVGSTSATLNGSANPNSFSTTGWFRYSTTNPSTCNDTFGTRTPASGGTALGSGGVPASYTASLTGLSTGTTYYYCALASNANGTASGGVSSFVTSAPSKCLATGGTITYTDSSGLNPRSSPSYAGGYAVHTFTSSGTFSQSCSQNITYLLVAGGGSGGSPINTVAGGGGGGEVISGTTTPSSGTGYTITIGNGGTGGGAGGDTSAFGVIVKGGGGGGSGGNPVSGSGGSGAGGKSGHYGPYAGGSSTKTSPGLGNAGGSGNDAGAGGGGGAGAVGQNAWFTWPDNHGGNGGAGYTSALSGVSTMYGAGGGGGGGNTYSDGADGVGGYGGNPSSLTSGRGATYPNDGSVVNGGAATGYGNGGGGGAAGDWRGASAQGGAGSKGVVIIRYVYP